MWFVCTLISFLKLHFYPSCIIHNIEIIVLLLWTKQIYILNARFCTTFRTIYYKNITMCVLLTHIMLTHITLNNCIYFINIDLLWLFISIHIAFISHYFQYKFAIISTITLWLCRLYITSDNLFIMLRCQSLYTE